MSSSKARWVPTNITSDQLIMDNRGTRDCRFYCLPPFHGDPAHVHSGGGYPYHLVSQGHLVGTFTNWIEAKASITGFPDSANCGYYSVDDCVVAWQAICDLGLHPHPVAPAFVRHPNASASSFVNTSPRKSAHNKMASPSRGPFVVKREGTDPQLLADLKQFCSPVRSPPPAPLSKGGAPRTTRRNLSILRLEGLELFRAARMWHLERSVTRYRDMQRRGEEPDMLVTRSLHKASLFALEDAADEDEEDGA
ncbi:hypothetical protein C8R47DRAFT_1225738 [Mycena vitilis]|nr:hypothetical protein C8R47DRAFT_1225738 [Mycena vitilis]